MFWDHCDGWIEKECPEKEAIELGDDGKPKLSIDKQLRKSQHCQAYTYQVQLMELLVDDKAEEEKMLENWKNWEILYRVNKFYHFGVKS